MPINKTTDGSKKKSKSIITPTPEDKILLSPQSDKTSNIDFQTICSTPLVKKNTKRVAKCMLGDKYPPVLTCMQASDFQKWTVPQLQEFLADRNINKNGQKEKLVNNAFSAYNLNLPVVAQNFQEEEEERTKDELEKLKLEGGLVQLPNPKKLLDGWVKAPANLPTTTHDDVKVYLENNNAGKAFKAGRSLLHSGHLSEIRTHMISPNIRYCFIRCYCTPEQRVSNDPYDVWVCVHKDSGEVVSGECGCIAGIGGCCKHVGSLLWYIEQEVRVGRNLTCTSKMQAWSVPSKRQLKLHQPDMLNNITIKKHKPNQILSEITDQPLNLQRCYYDPRGIKDRNTFPLTDVEIDHLADITNGNCGIVLLKRAHNVNPLPDILHVLCEEEVTTGEHIELPLTIKDIIEKKLCTIDNFISTLYITSQQRALVTELTSKQSTSNDWFEYRNGRITASIFKSVVLKVNDNLEVVNPNKCLTAIKSVCGYGKKFTSKATSWGINNEKNAIDLYKKKMKKIHKKLSVQESGFIISLDSPYCGASPDGIVTCSCHKTGLLEIKCPWTYRGCTINEYVSTKVSCLEFQGSDIKLKKNHQYYYQVQCQMGVTGYKWCDFFLCTTQGEYLERIYFDSKFWSSCMQKCKVFYEKIIIPELLHRTVLNNIKLNNDVKDVIGSILDKIV